MPANNSLNLTSLDFDKIKANLIAFLQNQPQFADINFSGANINVLLDILSYNTYLNSFYLNMVSSETFLDSAQLTSSVVSIAKSLNYTPRSYKSSVATLNVSFPQSGLSTLTIPAGTRFSSKNSNGNFSFATRNSTVLYPSGGNFTANNLNVYEGKYFTDTYVVDNTIQNQRFIFSNQNIDIDSLNITVLENNGANTTLFTQASSLFGLSNTSTVYFLQATGNSYYEAVFGDGVFGRPPLNGATILANYMITAGSDGNSCSTNFTLIDNIGTINGLTSAISSTITVSANSFNGANTESTDSIKYNAPRAFQTQERAVTTNDYSQLILENYSDIKNVHVYGGETVNNSIQFGKVFVVPATYSGYNLTLSEKTDIQTFLSTRNVLGITPVLVDPTYLYLEVFSTVKYDQNQTTFSSFDIQNIVSNEIVSYNTTNLTNFNTEFKLSDFMAQISNADPSISSNETYVIMKKIISPALNAPSNINVLFNNPINPGSFYSSTFYVNGILYSYTDYNPNINSFSINQSSNGMTVVNQSNIVYLKTTNSAGQTSYTIGGNIDYKNGIINLGQININDFNGNIGVVFYAQPSNENVMSYNNDILEIDVVSGINLNIVTAKTS
jgi:hypothetical protein